MTRKRFFIQTFGCQMNVYDSERIGCVLKGEGYAKTADPEEADLIFLNTCSVREKPAQKVYSALGRFHRLKKRNPGLILGVGGCVAQQEGEGLLERFSFLDFVLGTKELPRLKTILRDLEQTGKRQAALVLEGRVDPYSSLPPYVPRSRVLSFVSIMQGCDNFCAYCVVPFVRGREVSRPSAQILNEIRSLAASGVKEVTLLGQNVNSYGQKPGGEIGFVRLLEEVEEVAGIERIRFTTSHPKDLSPELIGAFGRLRKLCEHIHLPLQSGSNRILERMNRGYTREDYWEKVQALRRRCPDIGITADLIVGFPGETEADFADTVELIERVQFDDFFSFKYSDRPLTRARLFADKVPEEVSQKRLEEIQTLQKRITRLRSKRWEEREVEVLVEGRSKASAGESAGRTRTHHRVNFPGRDQPEGCLVKLKISRAYGHSLRGELLSGREEPS
jgi:tRNA-2-methylthio-N6-dimethylallyladenosine synthase